MNDQLLGQYLQDHLAGAAGGLALARRCLKENPEGPLGRTLTALVADIVDDQELLTKLCAALSFRQPRLKRALAQAGELLGRLKLNGRWVTYSPLSRVLELELLSMASTGRRSILQHLERLAPHDPRLQLADYAARARRVDARMEELSAHRQQAALQAFTGRDTGRPRLDPLRQVH